MYNKVRRFSGFTVIVILCFMIDQVLAVNYYEINDRYPIYVRQFRGVPLRAGSKTSGLDQNDFPYTGIEHNASYDLFQNDGTEIQQRKHRPKHFETRHIKQRRTCVRCPDEITAVAREGLDGILVDPPAPLSCKTNLPFSSNLYTIETLFGTLSFVLPHGKHTLIGKIRNVETGLYVRSCRLKYNVIVRRCHGFPHIKNKHLKMSCTAGNIFGSACVFASECKIKGTYISHQKPMICNENLEWSGHEPECVRDMDNDLQYTDDEEYCTQPPTPANGRYLCESENGAGINDIKSRKMFAPESICRVKCAKNFDIPIHLHPFSILQCSRNGAWNTTDIEVCYKKAPRRRHLSRRNRNGRTSKQQIYLH